MKPKDTCFFTFNDTESVEFRVLSKEDSIEELTLLLNRAYKTLADLGLNYVAATQGQDVTLKRDGIIKNL